MTKSKRRLLQFGTFNLVGLLGAALQVALLWILTRCLRLPLLVSIPVAVEIVLLHNFLLAKPDESRMPKVILWRPFQKFELPN